MKKLIQVLAVAGCCVLVSCGDNKTTAQLANEVATQAETLPTLIESVKDRSSAEAAASEIHTLRDAIRAINVQVKEGKFLTAKERGAVEKRLRSVRGESEFLLQKLSGKPELVLILTEPIAQLGSELEVSRRLMKEGAQEK